MKAVAPKLRAAFQRLAEGNGRWPLFLFGPAGSGKTSAALALCDIADSAAYYSAEELADFVMAFGPAEAMAEWGRIGSKSLAVLDEIGARQKVGDLAYSVVKRFADSRREQMPAIYISNVHPSLIADLFDDRVASRLLCGTILELTDNDRRRAS